MPSEYGPSGAPSITIFQNPMLDSETKTSYFGCGFAAIFLTSASRRPVRMFAFALSPGARADPLEEVERSDNAIKVSSRLGCCLRYGYTSRVMMSWSHFLRQCGKVYLGKRTNKYVSFNRGSLQLAEHRLHFIDCHRLLKGLWQEFVTKWREVLG